MRKYFVLLFTLSLALGCNRIGLDAPVLLTAQEAQALVQPTLDQFSHCGVQVSRDIIPENTYLNYNTAFHSSSIWIVKNKSWLFRIGPNKFNGAQWLYLQVDARSGEIKAFTISVEVTNLEWKELYPRDEQLYKYSLLHAENTYDPLLSAWKEIATDSRTLERGGSHAWIRRFDSEEELRAAFSGEYDEKAIDWAQKTLLLVAGVEMYENAPFDMTLLAQEGTNKYQIDVCRYNTFASAIIWWARLIQVDKLPADADVTVTTSNVWP